MLTVPEAARLAGRDPETVRRWIRAGKLRAQKVGTQHVIDEDDLAAFLGTPSDTGQGHEIHEAAALYGASASAGPTGPALDLWLPQIVGRLVRAMDPVRIELYGSRARGDQHPDSDYELLVVLDQVEDRRAARLEVRRLLDDLPISKDVLVATISDIDDPDDPPWGALYWALQEGKTIYDRP
jgi:excisionase family DNA binding protein